MLVRDLPEPKLLGHLHSVGSAASLSPHETSPRVE
jgi:hypothetical protein